MFFVFIINTLKLQTLNYRKAKLHHARTRRNASHLNKPATTLMVPPIASVLSDMSGALRQRLASVSPGQRSGSIRLYLYTVDYNECKNNTFCPPNTKCENTIGSYKCTCSKRGQIYDPVTDTCQRIFLYCILCMKKH